MKRILLPLAAVLCLTATADAQKLVPQQKINAAELKATLNPSDVSFLATPNTVDGLFDGVAPVATAPVRRAPLARLDAAEVDTVSYFAVAQSFHVGYTFNYEGGDIFTYNVGLALDGTKATFTNLFDMLASSAGSYYQSYDYPVDGVYDADAKTITIATGTSGVACGNYMGGYYTAMLMAGTVSESGTLTPAEELVFDVTVNEDGTIASITSRTSFLAKYDYGNIRVYKSFTAVLPNEEVANVFTFTESVDFGECFVGTSASKSIQLINNGGKDADFVIELEAEDDAFTSAVTGGTVPAQGTLDLSFDFLAPSKALSPLPTRMAQANLLLLLTSQVLPRIIPTIALPSRVVTSQLPQVLNIPSRSLLLRMAPTLLPPPLMAHTVLHGSTLPSPFPRVNLLL